MLNFLNIHPGHAFTRRMYAKFSHMVKIDKNPNVNPEITVKFKLKQYYHINLDVEFCRDCQTWLTFLEKGRLSVCCPYVDLSKKYSAKDLFLFTDSSAKHDFGFGLCSQRTGYLANGRKGFIREDPSIAFLELYAVGLTIFTWAAELKNLRFSLFCDNQSVVNMINKTTSGCSKCMVLIRMLTLKSLEINTCIFAKFVPTKQNVLTDALSRQNLAKFRRDLQHLGMNGHPSQLSAELWLLSKFWCENIYA